MWAHPCGAPWVDSFLSWGEMKAEWLRGFALEPARPGSSAGLGLRSTNRLSSRGQALPPAPGLGAIWGLWALTAGPSSTPSTTHPGWGLESCSQGPCLLLSERLLTCLPGCWLTPGLWPHCPVTASLLSRLLRMHPGFPTALTLSCCRR